MKRCFKCKLEKELTEYNICRSNADGRQDCCRECGRLYRKQRYRRRAEIERKQNREYNRKHREEKIAYNGKYNATAKGHLRRVYYDFNRRCNDPKLWCYKNYGGRGIKNKFKSGAEFIDYVLNTLKVDPIGLTIDRIDNNGHYEKGNIRFVTQAENNRNKWR